MVDHHRQRGQVPRQGWDMAQVLDIEEQIERHTMFLQNLEAAQHVRPEDKIVVWFVLRDVADADKLRMSCELKQLLFTRSAGQIHPADHAHYERMPIGQRQHPTIFGEVMLRLYEDRAADRRVLNHQFKMFGQEVPLDRRKGGRVEPAVVERLCELPKVLVGINHRIVHPSMRTPIDKSTLAKRCWSPVCIVST